MARQIQILCPKVMPIMCAPNNPVASRLAEAAGLMAKEVVRLMPLESSLAEQRRPVEQQKDRGR